MIHTHSTALHFPDFRQQLGGFIDVFLRVSTHPYLQTKEDVATLTDHIIVCVFGDNNSPTVGLRNLVSSLFLLIRFVSLMSLWVTSNEDFMFTFKLAESSFILEYCSFYRWGVVIFRWQRWRKFCFWARKITSKRSGKTWTTFRTSISWRYNYQIDIYSQYTKWLWVRTIYTLLEQKIHEYSKFSRLRMR